MTPEPTIPRRALLLAAVLIGLAGAAWARGSGETGDAGGAGSAPAPLRIGLLTDADSMPFLVAESEGLFEEAGVPVECLVFQNPVERDAAFQAGRVDGVIADLLGAVFSVRSGAPTAITSVTSGRYGLAGAPGSGFAGPGDLAGVEIGVSSNTIIEYVASGLLAAAGVPPGGFVPLAVPKIPVRMELLLGGQLAAACLPEPLYSLALSKGAVPLGDSTSLGEDLGVLLFDRSVAEDRTDDLVKFYEAYWRACVRINADPDSYRGFLVDAMGFPPEIRDDFAFVAYAFPRLPAPSAVDAVTAWMIARGLIDRAPAYRDLCDGTAVSRLRED